MLIHLLFFAVLYLHQTDIVEVSDATAPGIEIRPLAHVQMENNQRGDKHTGM